MALLGTADTGIPHVRLNFGPYGAQPIRNTTGFNEALGTGITGSAPSPPGGGFTPSYGQNLLDDPLYRQLQAQLNAQNQAAQSQAGVGFGQALANYGQIPDLTAAAQQLGLDPASPLYGILTGAAANPNTVQAAQNLTNSGLSTAAHLSQQHQTAIGNLLNNLAARGAVQSGDTGTGLRLEDQANSQRQYDAQQTLLQNLQKIIGGYNTEQQNAINQLQQGAGQAAARQIALNPAVPAATAATLAPLLTGITGNTGAATASGGLG